MTGDLDLAIVGAGPAGMAAAVRARELGLSVAVFDQNQGPGGQVYRAIEKAGGPLVGLLGPEYAAGVDLARAFRSSGAAYHPGTSVFEIARGGSVGCLGPKGAYVLRPAAVLIAAGAMERPVPFPGWTLPGVMTAGAVQTVLKGSGIVPDETTIIAGTGPLTYLLARQLLAAGAPVAALIDTGDPASRRPAMRHLPAALISGWELWRGLRWLHGLRRTGLRRITGARVLRAVGDGAVEAVEFEHSGRREALRCSLLVVHEGVVPNTHLAMASGCKHRWNEFQAAWQTETDSFGRTSVRGIYAAGDGAAIGGAEAALLRGRLAATAIAQDLGRIDAPEAARLTAPALRRLGRLGRIRRFLDLHYRPRPEVLCPPDAETEVCRCEEVTAGEIRRIAALGCPGPNQAKSFCRAGMGPCQGRICGGIVAAVLAQAQGRSVEEVGHLNVRPPVKPITIGQMAGLLGLGSPPSFAQGPPTAPMPDDAQKSGR